jgi:TRAP-type C4-dicarboxylate transport system permease small subunit
MDEIKEPSEGIIQGGPLMGSSAFNIIEILRKKRGDGMKALSRVIDYFESILISVCIFASITISVLGVFFRYVMGSSLSFVEESAGFLLLMVISIGVGAAVHQGKHLRVDMLMHFIPKTKKTLDIIADVVALGIMTLLCYLAFTFFADLHMRGQASTSLTWLPLAVPVLFMPLGYLTAVLRLIENLWSRFKNEGAAKIENVLPKSGNAA